MPVPHAGRAHHTRFTLSALFAMSRLLILASKLGYQTRSFAEGARALGVEVILARDRCHQLEDPWSDGTIAILFIRPGTATLHIISHSLLPPPQSPIHVRSPPHS